MAFVAVRIGRQDFVFLPKLRAVCLLNKIVEEVGHQSTLLASTQIYLPQKQDHNLQLMNTISYEYNQEFSSLALEKGEKKSGLWYRSELWRRVNCTPRLPVQKALLDRAQQHCTYGDVTSSLIF